MPPPRKIGAEEWAAVGTGVGPTVWTAQFALRPRALHYPALCNFRLNGLKMDMARAHKEEMTMGMYIMEGGRRVYFFWKKDINIGAIE